MYKVIVAHPGKQHSFRLATALNEGGLLFHYITTVYRKHEHPSFLTRVALRFLNSDGAYRLNGRCSADLSDEKVLQFCEFRGFIETFLFRFNRTLYDKYRRHTAKIFGKKVAKFAIDNKVDAVVLYDTNAENCFKILKKKAPNILRVLDVSATAAEYVKKIYDDEVEKTGDDTIMRENMVLWNQKEMQERVAELHLSNNFLVASSFVKDSLIYSGIDERAIFILPYGIDANMKFSAKKNNEKVKFLFVGNVNYNKGIPYILDAFSKISDCSLTIVGAYDKESVYFKKYSEYEGVNFVGSLTHDKVDEFYCSADVFVIFSFADGFAQVVTEAMSYGLPVICSDHVGAKDLIVDSVNGFVVKSGDVNMLQDKMEWFVLNRGVIEEMGNNARSTVKEKTWTKYNHNAQTIINQMIQGIKNEKSCNFDI